MVRLGVMGGTFDPVHNGHLAIAVETRRRLELDYVLFVPAGQPWLKSELPVSTAEYRYEMVCLAIQPYPGLRVSRIEIDRPGPSYTVDTLTQVRSELGESRLFFIIGWDCLPQLPQWYKITKLIELCEIAAVPRPGYSFPDLENLGKEIPGIERRIVLLDSPKIDISATEIRSLVSRGWPITGLVPEAVQDYIVEKKLYRN